MWDEEIERALIDAPQVVLLLSPASVGSGNVSDQVSYALGRGKSVIPVIYRDCVVPFRLLRTQLIDFRADYDRGLRDLLERLRATLSARSIWGWPKPGSAGQTPAGQVPASPPTPSPAAAEPSEAAPDPRIDFASITPKPTPLAGFSGLPGSRTDKVHFSVSYPPAARVGVTFIVDVWAHLEQQRAEVERRIRQASAPTDSPPVIRPRGPFDIQRGTRLFVRLKFPDCRVESTEETIDWDGEIGNASFVVAVPADAAHGPKTGLVTVHWEGGLQIARVPIQVDVVAEAHPTGPTTHPVPHIHKAFASYASPDRDEVLGRIQGMQKIAPDLEVFLDVAKLRSGEDSGRLHEGHLRPRS